MSKIRHNPKGRPFGLTDRQVLESRQQHGDNVLTPPRRKSLWIQFVEKFDDPLIKILLVALLLSVGISGYEYFKLGAPSALLEPVGIFVAIVLATLVGFLVEVNANKKFELLNRTNDDQPVKVRRNGRVTTVARRDVVVGDIVLLDTGDRVPADGQLLDAVSLAVDESSLTGEPLAKKTTTPTQEQTDQATYPPDMLMRGSAVLEGHGIIGITAVGDNTEYGQVFQAAKVEVEQQTPLMSQFDRLGRLIARGSYLIAALIIFARLVIYYFDGQPNGDFLTQLHYWIQTIMLAVTLVVVSVPEGLPMSVTLSLALSMRRMLQNNNLVRKLHACETMGATTIICTDKTGTLTENRMDVYQAHFDPKHLNLTATNICCNSTAFIDTSDPERPRVLGNPTEGALLLYIGRQNIDYLTVRETHDIVVQLPFSTERKLMATIVHDLEQQFTLLVKGAPEIIMRLCQIDDDQRRETDRLLAEYQNKAMRTLAFASRQLSPNDTDDFSVLLGPDAPPLQFNGFVAISDPVRQSVPHAIADCHSAGVDVKIVTGDTANTAREVGRQTGIWTDSDTDDQIITGPEFAALDDAQATEAARNIRIMARARPADKARLVDLLQRSGEVVAVTGDGTNDAPALNIAQVGLSMGDGTSVAKEASDITILDNSFNSINKAVLWGRSLYKNIQRFITFQLTVNICACFVVAVCSFFSKVQVPLTVTQMLWVNLIMDTFAALALASLPPNSIVMRVPPRRQSDNIITREMGWFIVGVGLLMGIALTATFYHLLHNQPNPMHTASLTPVELSKFFTLFVFMQFWNLFNAKSFGSGHSAFHKPRRSKVFFAILAVIFIGQVMIVQYGGAVFGCAPMQLSDWAWIVGLTSPIMLAGEAYHFIHRRRERKE